MIGEKSTLHSLTVFGSSIALGRLKEEHSSEKNPRAGSKKVAMNRSFPRRGLGLTP
jgi:hypothetical protein